MFGVSLPSTPEPAPLPAASVHPGVAGASQPWCGDTRWRTAASSSPVSRTATMPKPPGSLPVSVVGGRPRVCRAVWVPAREGRVSLWLRFLAVQAGSGQRTVCAAASRCSPLCSLRRGRSEQHVDLDRCGCLRPRASQGRVGQVQRLPFLPRPGEPRGSGDGTFAVAGGGQKCFRASGWGWGRHGGADRALLGRSSTPRCRVCLATTMG